MNRKERSREILLMLRGEYPDAKGTALKFDNPMELLVATILSAQCTDERVNEVTKLVFSKYRTIVDYASAELSELEDVVRPTGFFRAKAGYIKRSAEMITKDFGSEVPMSMEELVKLPGVARKTANIVLTYAFNIIEGIAVDTHVLRLSGRFGLTSEKARDKIEKDLMELYPKGEWSVLSDLLIAHGRAICKARTPKCRKCVLVDICPSAVT